MCKVRFKGHSEKADKWGNNDPSTCLTPGAVYTVVDMQVHSWHTKLVLKEFPGKRFNSVLFESILRR